MVLEHHFLLLPSVTDTSGAWGPSSSGITLILVDTVHPNLSRFRTPSRNATGDRE